MRIFGDHADNPRAVLDQLARALFKLDRDVAIKHRLEQRASQRLPQAPVVTRLALGQRLGVQCPGDGLHQAAAQGIGHLAGVDAGGPFAQPLKRESIIVEAAPAIGLGAGHIGLIIGEIGISVKAHRGLVGEITDQLGAILHKRAQRFRVQLLGRQRVKVGDDILIALGDARLKLMMIARNPQHPARHRCRAAHHAALFQNDHVASAKIMRRNRRRHRRPARAQHDNVRLQIPCAVVAHRPSPK